MFLFGYAGGTGEYGELTAQLQKCLEDAYESAEHRNSPEAILNMGKEYVLFFIKNPENFG